MTWQEQRDKAVRAFEKGQYSEAIRAYKNTIAQIEEADEKEPLGTVYGALGEVLFRQGRYDDAEQAFEKALECLQGERPDIPESIDAANLLTEAGAFFADRQNYELADDMLARALAMKKKVGADEISVSKTLNEIGISMLLQDKYAQAEPMFSQSLGIHERRSDTDNIVYAETLNNLAVLNSKKKNYDLAEPLCKRALTIREKKLGADHPDVSESLHNLGVQYLKRHKTAEAETLFRRTLSIQERVFTATNPRIVMTLNHLASVCLALNKIDDAIEFYKRALEISERTNGGDKHHLMISVAGLGMTYLRAAKFKEAEPYIKRSLSMMDDVEEDHGTLEMGYLNELFTCYIFQGKFGDALSLIPDTMRAKHTTQVNDVLDALIKVGGFASRLFEKKDDV